MTSSATSTRTRIETSRGHSGKKAGEASSATSTRTRIETIHARIVLGWRVTSSATSTRTRIETYASGWAGRTHQSSSATSTRTRIETKLIIGGAPILVPFERNIRVWVNSTPSNYKAYISSRITRAETSGPTGDKAHGTHQSNRRPHRPRPVFKETLK